MVETSTSELSDILLRCEENLPWKYGEKRVAITTDGREVIVVSDLHLGRGLTSSGTYPGTENFFANEDFGRFLKYVHQKILEKKNKQILLVINGDFIDFLRIMPVPETEDDFLQWESILKSTGINDKPVSFLKTAITPKEKKFGLKTHDYKSVWKLDLAIQGHSTVFDALAGWIGCGHHLLITKGNHDLEWYWFAVRNYLRLSLARKLNTIQGGIELKKSLEIVLNSVTFVDDTCVIDSTLYVEHGHNYDHLCRVVGGPTVGKADQELNLPFGSFFNRYLVNELELVYPYYDNVRPKQNILHMLMRDHFFSVLKCYFAISLSP
jgi:UDP-2,3-diacylglucosamine pyrophosphatase LpxH